MNGARSVAAAAVLVGVLAAGCSAERPTAVENSPADKAVSAAPGFFDPCDATMNSWLLQQGYAHPAHLETIRDSRGSGCAYRGDRASFSLLSQPATPGDATDKWVRSALGLQGPVSQTTLAGYPIDIEVISSGRQRQDCHLVATVGYGFLEVTGGPRSPMPDTFPRDCDAAQTFTAMLLRHMDQIRPG